ncbi:MAG: hypothetical protein ACM3X9_14030 [Bacillota bacterium]
MAGAEEVSAATEERNAAIEKVVAGNLNRIADDLRQLVAVFTLQKES